MDIMVSESPDDLEAAEVAAQVLAMAAADDQRSPHLMRVDKWVLSCTRILRKCCVSVCPTVVMPLPCASFYPHLKREHYLLSACVVYVY